jgi:hypothetical protein
MAKTASDLGTEGHINGDADGMGCVRGTLTCLAIEAAAFLVFAGLLYVFWS